MAKLTGKKKQEFLDRMAKGRAKKGGGKKGGGKKGSRSSSSGASSQMVPYMPAPLAMYTAGKAPASRSGSSGGSTKQRLTTALDILSKKQAIFASMGSGALLALAEDQDLMKSIPALSVKDGLGPEFTIAAVAYFGGDSSILARYPKLRSFVMSIADSTVGIATYKLVRRYLQQKRKDEGKAPVADVVPWSVSGDGGGDRPTVERPKWQFREEL